MLRVDGFFQPVEFALQRAQLRVVPLEQTRLEPAVEMFDAALALRVGGRDEHRLHAKPQTQAQDPREVARGRAPAYYFAGIVELGLSGQAKALPALAQEAEDNLHLAGPVDSQANGAIVEVLADEDVVPLPLAFEVDRADAIHLMELVGLVGLGDGIGVVGQVGRQVHTRRGHPIAFEDSLEGAQAGQRPNMQGLQFG